MDETLARLQRWMRGKAFLYRLTVGTRIQRQEPQMVSQGRRCERLEPGDEAGVRLLLAELVEAVDDELEELALGQGTVVPGRRIASILHQRRWGRPRDSLRPCPP